MWNRETEYTIFNYPGGAHVAAAVWPCICLFTVNWAAIVRDREDCDSSKKAYLMTASVSQSATSHRIAAQRVARRPFDPHATPS